MNSLSDAQMRALEELVDKMKKGEKYESDYIQVGGQNMLLATFFNQVLASLSKDLPKEHSQKILTDIKRKIPTMEKEELKKMKDYPGVAPEKWVHRPNDFRAAMQRHISKLPPQYQLPELNRIQKKAPFSLLDPKGKKQLSAKSTKYGYADLYNFLGFPYSKGIVRSSMQGQNPFYHPLKMPVPDVYGNNVLSHIKRFGPSQKLMEAKDIYKELMSKSGGAPLYLVNPKILDEGYDTKIKRMAQLTFDVANRVYSPVTLSHFVKGQERPMKQYLDQNFNTMLWELNKVHLIKPISPAPEKTNYSLSDSALDQIMRKHM